MNIWSKILWTNVFSGFNFNHIPQSEVSDAISFKMHRIYISLSAKNLWSSIPIQPLILAPSILHLISHITLLCQIGKWMFQKYHAKIVANFSGIMHKLQSNYMHWINHSCEFIWYVYEILQIYIAIDFHNTFLSYYSYVFDCICTIIKNVILLYKDIFHTNFLFYCVH